MAIADDHTIDYAAKTVTHTSGTTIYTMLEYFQFLALTFAITGQMDDEYPIEALTKRDFKWLNGWGFGDLVEDIKFLSGGGIESSDGQEQWATVYSIGTVAAGSQFYIIQDSNEITPWWAVDTIDVLIRIKTAGVLIDSGKILVMCREYGDDYDHFEVNMTASGYNPASINTAVDGNNQTAEGTVSGYGISITFGTVGKDLNNGSGSKNYDVVIDGNGKTMPEIYEYLKYATQHNSAVTINADSGEEYLGADPSYIKVKKAPFGTLAGGVFFGARGIWVENYSGADFELISSDGSGQTPPNLKNVLVSHASLSGTHILVAEVDGSNDIIKNQYTLSSTTTNTVTMTATIDQNKAPQTGTVRFDNTEYTYTGINGAQLTGVTPDPSAETGAAYIPLLSVIADAITEVSGQIIYISDFPVKSVVRQYGIKPFEQIGVFGVNGLSVTPVISNDLQAS